MSSRSITERQSVAESCQPQRGVASREATPRCGWPDSATDWRSVIERDDIQIVDICGPRLWMHAEIAIAALEAGKHVLVEKPLANSLAESEAMVSPARGAM